VYIVDKNGALLPPGRTGEIVVGGKGVAQGYLHRDELTREKFINSPFCQGERAYLTGDLGRWTTGGDIEFLGRKDNQVKIRGYRIEPGEIESRLLLYSGIKTVAVIVQVVDGDPQLIAFFTAATKISNAVLREYLQQCIPAHMVPAYFMQLDMLLLTPNGKTDKKALQQMRIKEDEEANYIGPRNSIENKLINIWRQLLGREKIGIQQNFFAIGGHSLKAVQMLSAIAKDLEVRLHIRDLFDHPTVELLAKKIATSDKASFHALEALPVQPDYETSHAQKRLWLLAQMQDSQLSYNMSAAYRFSGNFRRDVFENVFFSLLERHESLRTVFENVEGDIRQKILRPEESGFNIRFIDIMNDPDKQVAEQQLIRKEINDPFDLAKGPLVRVTLIRKEENEYVFLFTMHHIISDAWSLEVLLKEVLLVYEAYSQDRPTPLLPLRIQYKEYASWHNKLVKGDKFSLHKKYWLEEFEGTIPVLALPEDFIRPKIKTNRGEDIGFIITGEQTAGLKAVARENEATLFIVLLAIVQALLHRYSGQEDIITGSPIAGRDHAELENQIGLFLNNISIRSRFKGVDRFSDLLSQVKDKCLLAYEHQAYPFDLLISDLNVRRDLSRSPLFDVVVVLQNAQFESVGEKEMKDVQVMKFDSGFRTSTIDIRIVFTELQDYITCVIEYNTDIFKKETIVTFFNNLSLLINGVNADVNTRIIDLVPADKTENHITANLTTSFNF
jgi:acyl carrier protein